MLLYEIDSHIHILLQGRASNCAETRWGRPRDILYNTASRISSVNRECPCPWSCIHRLPDREWATRSSWYHNGGARMQGVHTIVVSIKYWYIRKTLVHAIIWWENCLYPAHDTGWQWLSVVAAHPAPDPFYELPVGTVSVFPETKKESMVVLPSLVLKLTPSRSDIQGKNLAHFPQLIQFIQ